MTAPSHGAALLPTEDDAPPSVWMPVVPDVTSTSEAPAPTAALVAATVTPHRMVELPEHEVTAPAEEPMAKAAPPTQEHVRAARSSDVPELPKISLELPPDSGLVLIETSRDRAAVPDPVEQGTPPHSRRVRPPRAEVREEPLQLIETAHKDPTTPVA
ncbi:MAG: hypothetical protein ACREYB_03655 [Casimicrobiaceae bacterium]